MPFPNQKVTDMSSMLGVLSGRASTQSSGTSSSSSSNQQHEQVNRQPSDDAIPIKKELASDNASVKAEQQPTTPKEKTILQERSPPSSIDSFDEMTLEEMQAIANGQQPGSALSRAVPRSLTSAMNAAAAVVSSSSTINTDENVDPRRLASNSNVAGMILPSSLKRCVPLQPSQFSSISIEQAKQITLPQFSSLVNFPHHHHEKVIGGAKHCVMCGHSRPCFKKRTETNGGAHILLAHKGVCSLCESIPWTYLNANGSAALQMKFCTQCQHFKALPLFAGLKSTRYVNSCLPCRDGKKIRAKKRKEKKELLLKQQQQTCADSTKPSPHAVVAMKRPSPEDSTTGSDSVAKASPTKRAKLKKSESPAAETSPSSSDGSPLGPNDRWHSSSPPTPPLSVLAASTDDDNKKIAAAETKPSSTTPTSEPPKSRNRCVPFSTPLPAKALKSSSSIIVPTVSRLMNFSQDDTPTNGSKQCVMCGESKPLLNRKDAVGTTDFLPLNNKGVCASCESLTWEVASNKALVRWCTEGLHFRPIAMFVEKKKGEEPKFKKCCHACQELYRSFK